MSEDEDRLGDLCHQLKLLRDRGEAGSRIIEALVEDSQRYDLRFQDVSVVDGVLSFSILGLKIEVRLEGTIATDGPRSKLVVYLVPKNGDEAAKNLVEYSFNPLGSIAQHYTSSNFSARFFSDLLEILKEREETFGNLKDYSAE